MPIKISIITINYQNGLGLEKTINSVLSQTYNQIEYIIIDGGSTDCSMEVIDKYSDDIFYIISEKDSGIYHAMNKGWKKANGDYCLFLNSGDYLYDNHVLETLVGFMQNEIADIFYGNLFAHDEKRSFISRFNETVSLYYFHHSFIPHPAAFIKRSVLYQFNGFYEQYKTISDWAFFVSCFINNVTFKHVDLTITSFYMQGVSSSSENSTKDKQVLFNNEFKFLVEDFKNFDRLRHFDTSIITKLARKVSLIKMKYFG